jgi:tRNA/rRNA methyltransferase
MIHIILLEPEHEGNVGAICRAIANFGFKDLVIVNPKCNLESDELYRRAKHSKSIVKNIKVVKRLPKYDLLIGSTSKLSNDYNVARTPLSAEQLAEKLTGIKTKKNIGLLFGKESIGLTNKEIAKCNFLVSINTDKSYPVLNLSHAVAILLYEIHRKQGKTKLLEEIEPATQTELKQMEKMTADIIDKANFNVPGKITKQKQIWKNIFNKSMMSKREAFGVMGLLSKIKKNMRK